MRYKDQVHVFTSGITTLGYRANRNTILSKNICTRSQNTRAVSNYEANVVFRFQIVNSCDGKIVSTGTTNNWLNAHLNVTSNF